VQQDEAELAEQLRVVGERHAAEHDVYHLAHTLAQQCTDHIRQLRPFVEGYGAHPPQPRPHQESKPVGRFDATGMRLLQDLRECYLAAQRVEVDWTILLQAARAARDADLAGVVTSCQEEAEHAAAWLRTKIKEGAPQVLTVD
jgi:hypothetical protein